MNWLYYLYSFVKVYRFSVVSIFYLSLLTSDSTMHRGVGRLMCMFV